MRCMRKSHGNADIFYFTIFILHCIDKLFRRWYALRNKTSSKKAEKYRGEIEVKVTFIVQSVSSSHTSLNKAHSVKGFKRSSSIKTLAHSVGEC